MKLSANQAKVVYKYKNLKLKVLKAVQNIRFNKECLWNNITPKYIAVKINNSSVAAKKVGSVGVCKIGLYVLVFIYLCVIVCECVCDCFNQLDDSNPR